MFIIVNAVFVTIITSNGPVNVRIGELNEPCIVFIVEDFLGYFLKSFFPVCVWLTTAAMNN